MKHFKHQVSALLLAVGLVLSLTSATPKTYYYGDLNHDGEVTVTDVTLMVRHLRGEKTINFNLRAADVDRNGRIDRFDLTHLINMVLGKEELVPLPEVGTGGSGQFD